MAIKIKPVVDSQVSSADRLRIQQPPFGGLAVSAPSLPTIGVICPNAVLPQR